MKKILFYLMFMVLLIPLTTYSQGSSPSAGKFKLSSGALENRTGDSLFILDKTTGDTLMTLSPDYYSIQMASGDTVLTISSTFANFVDSLNVGGGFYSTNVTVGGVWITIGDGTLSSAVLRFRTTTGSIETFYYTAGLEAFTLSDSLIVQGDVRATGDITGDDGYFTDIQAKISDFDILDSNGVKRVTITEAGVVDLVNSTALNVEGRILAEDSIYLGAIDADSLVQSLQYLKHHLFGDTVLVGTPANIGDDYVLKRDSANGRYYFAQEAGDTGITVYGFMADTTVDTNFIDGSGAGTFVGWTDTIHVHIENGMTYKDTTAGDWFILDSTGTYQVAFSWSSIGSNAATITAALFINSTQRGDFSVTRKMGTGADVGAAGFQGIGNFTAGDTLQIKFATDNTTDIGVAYAQLAIHRVDGSVGGGGGSGSVDSLRVYDGTSNFDIWDKAIRLAFGSSFLIAGADSSGTDTLTLTTDTSWYNTNFKIATSSLADVASAVNGANITGTDVIPNVALQNDVSLLGQSIVTSNIADGTILEVDLDVSNAPTDNYVLTYNAGGGNFSWSVDATSGYLPLAGGTMAGDLNMGAGNNLITSSVLSISGTDLEIAGAGANDHIDINGGVGGNVRIYDASNLQWLFQGAAFIGQNSNTISGATWNGVAITESYIGTDAITATKIATSAVTTDEILDGTISVVDIGQNGADTANPLLKWNGSAWIAGPDLRGTGQWSDKEDTIHALITQSTDTVLTAVLLASDHVDADTVKLYGPDGAVLQIGSEGLTYIDSLSMDGEVFYNLTGYGLTLNDSALWLDTANVNDLYLIETGDTMLGTLYMGGSATTQSQALLYATADSIYFDSTKFKLSASLWTTENLVARENLYLRWGNTGEASIYFDSTSNNFLRYNLTGDTLYTSDGLYAPVLSTQTLTLATGETITYASGQFNFTGDVYANANSFITHGGDYRLDTTGLGGSYGLRLWNDGVVDSGYFLFSATEDHWHSSDPIMIGDTTIAGSTLATQNYVDQGQLNNVTIRGDFGILGNFYNSNFSNELDLDGAYARHSDLQVTIPANPKSYITVPDDSTVAQDSSLAVHPSNLYTPKGFYGNERKKKLMSFTPLINSVAIYENPYLVWANGGTDDWVPIGFDRTIFWDADLSFDDTTGCTADCDSTNVLTGTQFWDVGVVSTDSTDCTGLCDSIVRYTLDNPVFDTGDFTTSTHLSDPDIFWDDQERLWMIFNVTYPAKGDIVISMFDTTSDGLPTMTTPVIAINGDTYTGGLSGSVILDTNSTYTMWTVNPGATPANDSSVVVRFTCGATDSLDEVTGWSLKDTTSIFPPHDTLDVWHIEVIARGADELLILATCTDTVTVAGDSSALYVGTSYDRGVTVEWADSTTYGAESILAPDRTTADSLKKWARNVYRASGYWVDDGSDGYLNLYYSAYGPRSGGGGNPQWRIFNTELRFDGAREKVELDFDRLPGLVATDSTILTYDEVLAGVPITARDSAISASAYTGSDTLYFTWSTLPRDLKSIDTLIIEHMTSDTAQTDFGDIELRGKNRTADGSFRADSTYDNTLTVPQSRSIWVVDTIAVNSTDFKEKEQLVMRITVDVDGTENMYFGRVYLICTIKP